MYAARFYSQTMTQWGRGHNVGPYATNPNAAHGASANVAAAFGANLRWGGGNGGFTAGTAEDVVNQWMNSDGHSRYILSPEHRYIGAGSHKGSHYLFLSSASGQQN